MVNILLLIVGFVILIKGADLFVDNASLFAKSLGVSTIVVGLTVVALGTSAPELAVSMISSIKGNNSIAMGNVIGSNICNILLVLGASSLFGNLVCDKKVFKRDFSFALVISLVLALLCFNSLNNDIGVLNRVSGIALLCMFSYYFYILFKDSKNEKGKKDNIKFDYKYLILLCVGIGMVIIGGELVVNSATNLAKIIGISDDVVALSVIAIGTSLPELVTGCIAVKKGENDIAIGNVIGSSIFNIGLILGISATVSPISYNIFNFYDMIIMCVSILIVYLIIKFKNKIDKKMGILLLTLYFSYIAYLVFAR